MENLAASHSGRLSGLKVLVIDDSKTIRRTAETLLAKEGCEVHTAVDGFDALAKIADHRPDIIFVDIMMPRLDGYQTCSLIKHNKAFKDTPVIMLSSKDGIFDRETGDPVRVGRDVPKIAGVTCAGNDGPGPPAGEQRGDDGEDVNDYHECYRMLKRREERGDEEGDLNFKKPSSRLALPSSPTLLPLESCRLES